MIYIPDEAYRIQTNGNYNSSTFTGIVVYTDVNGHAFLSYKIVNGQIERLYNATVNRRRNAISRDCLAMGFPSCQYVFDWCGNITFCDCSGNCGAGMGGVFGPTGNSSGSSGSGHGFSYGGGFSGGAGRGSGGSGGGGSGGGGGAWNSSQPGSLFTMSEIEALRLKFRNANLDDIFYTLELNQALLKAANLFLDTKGWDNLNKPALERLVLATGEYAALAEYLTALCVYPDFYNAHVDLNFPVSAFTAFTKFTKAGFTTEEFVDLYADQSLFTHMNTFLTSHNFDANAANLVKLHKQTLLKDADYKQANVDANNPMLGTDAWVNTVFKFPSTPFLYNDYDELTAAEKSLVKSNPGDALKIRGNAKIAFERTFIVFGITFTDVEEAHRRGVNTKADAFRHAYFNALNSKFIDPNIVTAFANAHESEVSPHLYQERDMDLYNNSIGIARGPGLRNSTDIDISAFVEEWVRVGELKYLDPLDWNQSPRFRPKQDPNCTTCRNGFVPGLTSLKFTNQ